MDEIRPYSAAARFHPYNHVSEFPVRRIRPCFMTPSLRNATRQVLVTSTYDMGPIDVLSSGDNLTNAATWNGKYARSAYKIGINVTFRGEIAGVIWPRTSATSDTTVRARARSLLYLVV